MTELLESYEKQKILMDYDQELQNKLNELKRAEKYLSLLLVYRNSFQKIAAGKGNAVEISQNMLEIFPE